MTEENTKKSEIKTRINIYLYYWTLPALGAFLILNYYAPTIKLLDLTLLNPIISIVTFLFGFLITVTFTMLLARVAALKESLANETGRLVSLYLLSKHLGKQFHNTIREHIDNYTIKTLQQYTQYEASREIIYGMNKDIEQMEIKTEQQQVIAASFLYILGEFEPIREKLEYLTSRRTEWSIKFSNHLLGIILIILLFLNRGDSFSNAIFIILSTIIIFLFLIIEDYDELRIGDYVNNISNSEQIFDLIGKERYYPKSVLNRIKLEKGKTYRIGFYNKKTKRDEITTITYAPKKKHLKP